MPHIATLVYHLKRPYSYNVDSSYKGKIASYFNHSSQNDDFRTSPITHLPKIHFNTDMIIPCQC